MTFSENSKLILCPKCGSKAHLVYGSHEAIHETLLYAKCSNDNCGCESSKFLTEEFVISDWNSLNSECPIIPDPSFKDKITAFNINSISKRLRDIEKEYIELKIAVSEYHHNRQFKVGMTVWSSEYDEYGKITKINEDGTVEVEFDHPTHATWNISTIHTH